jgi:hypothetical protein
MSFGSIFSDSILKIQLFLTTFSTSNHKLPIECGRWQNIEINRRLCKLCQKQEIRDQFHYIMEYPFFKCKRKLLFKQK